MPTEASIVQRLRAVSEFGGTHLDGLWTEAADAIDRLDAALKKIAKPAKLGGKDGLPPTVATTMAELNRRIEIAQDALKHV